MGGDGEGGGMTYREKTIQIYEPTPEQEEAIRAYLRTSIMPLIEQVLVKKLGQAMAFTKLELEASRPGGSNVQS